jgi:hypothetical protein
MSSNRQRILHKHRWIKQRNSHSCVPVAILNIIKWAGVPVNYESDFDYWKEKVNLSADDGAHIRDYALLLKSLPNVKLQRKSRPTPTEIDAALSKGNAVLLRSAWKSNSDIRRHLLLIVGRTEKSWFLTNTYRGHAWFPKQVVETLYMENHRLQSGIYPTAWFVCKVTEKTARKKGGALCKQH